MPKIHKISIFIFTLMNVALVLSLRGIPTVAKTSWHMIFYLLFSTFLFLIPISLISAELATGWVKNPGVYGWVKEAFGSKLGFSAIWLQWIQNTIWYVTVLAFASGALSSLFLSPHLAHNKYFIISMILIIYWGATFINFKGLKIASYFTTICVIFGTFIPAAVIIILGILCFSKCNLHILTNSPFSFFPDFSNLSNIAFLAATLEIFSGIEVNAIHIREVDNPKKNYPKALLLTFLIIISIYFLTSFSIASCLPSKDISLTAGIMQGFDMMLSKFHLNFLSPVMGFLVAFGVIGSITAWIAGPSRGLLDTAKNGEIPPFLQYTNKNDVQTHILWIQGTIVSILSFIFLFIPNTNVAFYLLTALSGILYFLMYILLYASAIVLRYKHPNVERAFKIPFKNIGIIIIGSIGILAMLFAIIIAFIPPTQLEILNSKTYIWFLIICTIIFVTSPIIINSLKKPSWK